MSLDRGFKRINNGIACYVHRPHGVSSVRNGQKCCYWTFKYEPTFIKQKKTQIKKPSSNLEILPKLMPICCKILH